MAKDKLTEYSATNASNDVIGDISVAEGMLPSAVNNALREQMTHLKNFSDGTDAIDALAVDNLKLDGNTISSTNTNGDITLDPNGTGNVVVSAVLTANAGSIGMGPAFFAHPASAQSVSQATFTKIALGTEVYDTDSKFASDKFTPTIAGYYQINASVTFANATFTQAGAILQIRRNGSNYAGFNSVVGGFESRHGINGSALVYLDSDDYVEMWIYNTSSAVTIAHDTGETHFSGGMVRRA